MQKTSRVAAMKIAVVACVLLAAILCMISGVSVGHIGAMATDENTYVFVGGIPIGIAAYSDYFVVTEIVNINTQDGSFSPALRAGVLPGDIIVDINGKKISDLTEFNAEIQESDEVILNIMRNNEKISCTVIPTYDPAQNAKKIGILIRNDLTGIGTLTFVTEDGEYGGLGHTICDKYLHCEIYQHGKIYACEITGYNKPKTNLPGELRGNVDFSAPIGTINKNNIAGIYGLSQINVQNYNKIAVASKNEVVPGKAQIATTIGGNNPEYYDIEIIKTIKQDSVADKGLVIRITDKDLLDSTGGILQGMSGSPIIQNGKLVGAVTHVFTNDPTKGYGIYAEWMLKQIG